MSHKHENIDLTALHSHGQKQTSLSEAKSDKATSKHSPFISDEYSFFIKLA